MFEKSLYELIRGLRNHKGNEKEYIQDSLRECRKEIKSQDMDLKSTAVLKLTYLEMFGYDMSWASFNVLEVMSSQKYQQKRVGYLAAVQSFRADTEVLMLAENLLKKDLNSPVPIVVSLPLTTIPHVINPSMALSLLSDLLPRLTHSQPAIRKKTIVTLYRLALVYPETLRPAWPKIKDRLLDDNEDPSVTAAIVNVVCELGWRRPQDFLPLAPRLFDLLVQGGNNWMAIKIIKLFATLAPLEPRLIKKLLPPLTTIIKTTPAMSLLYECINGIIQGGILKGVEGTVEGEEIARLCVGKLRGMLSFENDANLKYVALLAFEHIVRSHPHLVSLHQDVILENIDDADISIRMRALDLVVNMVNSDNLTTIVGRLTCQLRSTPIASTKTETMNDRHPSVGMVPYAESSDDEAEESLRRPEEKSDQPPPIPEDYKSMVIKRILQMCSRDTYTNINDFDWYIDVLVQLVRVSPTFQISSSMDHVLSAGEASTGLTGDISDDIGSELQNVSVRVRSVRPEVTRAAQDLVLVDRRHQMFPTTGNGGQGVLKYAAWIVGEYADYLTDPDGVMTSLLHPSILQLPSETVSIYLQAIPKVFSSIAGSEQVSWTTERKTAITLLLARIIHFLEPLATHPNLEVQERAVEFLELMRLANEAVSAHQNLSRNGEFADPPLLLTQAIPSLFAGMELNPVAPGAQKKVPIPDGLDLDAPINENLQTLIQQAEYDAVSNVDEDEVYRFYYIADRSFTQAIAAVDRLETPKEEFPSYQQTSPEDYLDPDIIARRKAERRERHKDEPFYINDESGTSTPLHNIIKSNNAEDLDIDSIPIMDLNLDSKDRAVELREAPTHSKTKARKNFEILIDENLGLDEATSANTARPELVQSHSRGKRSLLEVDSSGLGSLSLEEPRGWGKLDIERREADEAEMRKALREVEKRRLEMQRAAERIQATGGPQEGVVVKRKKKKKKKAKPAITEGDLVQAGETGQPAKGLAKKKKRKVKEQEAVPAGEAMETVNVKKKKKRQVVFDEGEG